MLQATCATYHWSQDHCAGLKYIIMRRENPFWRRNLKLGTDRRVLRVLTGNLAIRVQELFHLRFFSFSFVNQHSRSKLKKGKVWFLRKMLKFLQFAPAVLVMVAASKCWRKKEKNSGGSNQTCLFLHSGQLLSVMLFLSWITDNTNLTVCCIKKKYKKSKLKSQN